MQILSLQKRVEADVRDAGLTITFISSSLKPDDMGDGEITGRLGSCLIRFVRDRGQDWVELAPEGMAAARFYFFNDIEIAFGWKTVAEVLDQNDVEPLVHVLHRIAAHWDELDEVLAAGSDSIAWARIAAAAKRRGQAFAARLR